MGNVKTRDIDFNHRYSKTMLFGDLDNPYEIKDNLEKLYAYIDKKEGGNPLFKYGKAYRKILMLARGFAGSRKYIISKRQVANLIKVYKGDKTNDNTYYVKIPYAANYIFQAIFTILEIYKEENVNDIPEDIINMFGQLRRDCFYKEQCLSYNQFCTQHDTSQIQRSLNDDLNSEESLLERKV